MLHKIESYSPFDVVFMDFSEPGYTPDQDGSRKILTGLDCMTGFWLGAAIGLKEITSDQAAQWYFGNFFVTFRIPNMIVVDSDGLFSGMFKKTFQKTLTIPVHAATRVNHKAIINEGFYSYLKKVQKINSTDKESLHQWLQGVLFALYACDSDPVDGTDIT